MSDLVSISKEPLTVEQYRQLEDVLSELGWLWNNDKSPMHSSMPITPEMSALRLEFCALPPSRDPRMLPEPWAFIVPDLGLDRRGSHFNGWGMMWTSRSLMLRGSWTENSAIGAAASSDYDELRGVLCINIYPTYIGPHVMKASRSSPDLLCVLGLAAACVSEAGMRLFGFRTL